MSDEQIQFDWWWVLYYHLTGDTFCDHVVSDGSTADQGEEGAENVSSSRTLWKTVEHKQSDEEELQVHTEIVRGTAALKRKAEEKMIHWTIVQSSLLGQLTMSVGSRARLLMKRKLYLQFLVHLLVT